LIFHNITPSKTIQRKTQTVTKYHKAGKKQISIKIQSRTVRVKIKLPLAYLCRQITIHGILKLAMQHHRKDRTVL
jgi:hypothetical protein